MYKKYKIKRKRHLIKVQYLIIILIMILMFASIGYSYWSTSLKIEGKVTSGEVTPDLPSEISQSTVTWGIVNEWGTGTSSDPKFYQVKIDIENHDGDMDEWELSFEVPDGIMSEKINSWGASSTTVEGIEYI